MTLLSLMNPWYTSAVVVAFAAVIGFFQINSSWADKNKWNKKVLVISIILALVAVVLFVTAIKTSR